ncbi:MAG: hypothetical protein AABX82_01805 [Nanoarchaeota archaeon]
MSRGTPTGKESDYFGEEVEEQMLDIVINTGYLENIGEDRREAVTNWLTAYVQKRVYATQGIKGLARFDYNAALNSVEAQLGIIDAHYKTVDSEKEREVELKLATGIISNIAGIVISHPDGPEAAARAWKTQLDPKTYDVLVTAVRDWEFKDDPKSTAYQTQFLTAVETQGSR